MMKFIEAKRGDIAPVVLLPGDPLRAEFLAKRYLNDVVCYTDKEHLYGYTGTFNGVRVSVQATGMGTFCASTCVRELIEDYGCTTLIRIGSCKSAREEIHINDLIASVASTNESSCHVASLGDYDFIPASDFTLLRQAAKIAQEENIRLHVGITGCCDVLKRPVDDPFLVASEMESTGLFYEISRHKGVRGLLLMTVGGHFIHTHEIIPAERRSQDVYSRMMLIALRLAEFVKEEA